MKKTAFSLVAALTGITAAPAATIAWVTVHPADDQPSTNAGNAGFTLAPDVGYTNLLAANGHTVTRILSSGTPNASLLNTYDLIIIGRGVPSSHYQNAAATNWNTQITAPMLIMSGYVIRQNRLGLMAGNDIPDLSEPGHTAGSFLTANDSSNPLFAGVGLDIAGTMNNAYVTPQAHNGVDQRGPSVVTGGLQGGGQSWATVQSAPNTLAIGATTVAFWSAGSSVTHAQSGGTVNVLAGDRGIFLSGTRENTITSEAAGIYDLTSDGAVLFLNMVDIMAIPEPATAFLGAFGALALGIRRRRAA
jgi:hypothetical protein